MNKPEVIELGTEEDRLTEKRRVGVVFPAKNRIILGYGMHNPQILHNISLLEQERKEKCLPALTSEEKENAFYKETTALIWNSEGVSIRPPPEMDNVEAILESDDLLQDSGLVPKHNIKFLNASNPVIRKAMMRRGELYRLACPPKTQEDIEHLISSSKTPLSSPATYFYNMETGTRWLTYEEFLKASRLRTKEELISCLKEIAEHSSRKNAGRNPEIDFFMADKNKFSSGNFREIDFENIGFDDLKETYRKLLREFQEAAEPKYMQDDLTDIEWRNAMLSTLITRRDEEIPEEVLIGLSPVYFMRLKWLPGARIEERELMEDIVYEKRKKDMENKRLEEICGNQEDIVTGLIENEFRENPGLKSINIGEVVSPLTQRQDKTGRRSVYMIEMEISRKKKPVVKVVRFQKKGIREFLDNGEDLGTAHVKSEEYTEYILDRNIACRQLGIDLPSIRVGNVAERYSKDKVHNGKIPTTYFERDYIQGRSTNTIPLSAYQDKKFSIRFAKLLGRAAAPNIIVGRTNDKGEALFDDGDEVLTEDKTGMSMKVSDFTGSFTDCESDLKKFIPMYALPIIRRLNSIHDKRGFAKNYVNAFIKRFEEIKDTYRRRPGIYHFPFQSRDNMDGYNLVPKWQKVLDRLDKTDPYTLGYSMLEEIMKNIH